MKKINLLVLVFLVLAGSAGKLAGQQSAYIYRDSILLATPHYVQKAQMIDSVRMQFGQEVQTLREQLQQSFNRLAGKYNPQEGEAFESLKMRMQAQDTIMLNMLLDEDALLSRKEQSYSQLVSQLIKKELEPLHAKINAAIAAYAKKNDLEVVWIMEELSGGMAWVNPELDITAIIKEKMLE